MNSKESLCNTQKFRWRIELCIKDKITELYLYYVIRTTTVIKIYKFYITFKYPTSLKIRDISFIKKKDTQTNSQKKSN